MNVYNINIFNIQFILLYAFLVCSPIVALYASKSVINMTPQITQAYYQATSLRLVESQKTLQNIRQQDPNNVMVQYVENYIDFFTVFIKEEKSDYLNLLANKDRRLEIIAQSDSSSPYYLFCKAEIILQVATVKLKFDDKVSAANDVFRAYKMLEENKQLFPNFIENNKSLSIIYALADSLPAWIRKLLGIKGSITQATTDIKLLADKAHKENNMFKDEIVSIYSYILFYVNQQQEEAFKLFDTYQCNHKTNPLIAFLKATFAQKLGNTPQAIKILWLYVESCG